MASKKITLSGVLSESVNKLGKDIGNNLLISLLYWLIMTVAGNVPFVNLIIGGPMAYGFHGAMLDVQRGKKPEIGRLFSGFSVFLQTLMAFIIVAVFILLWTIPFLFLLIIPGLISMILAIIRYSFTFFILNDDPEMDPNEARKLSVDLTVGHRGKIFIYCLISIIPLIGAMITTSALANLYDRVK